MRMEEMMMTLYQHISHSWEKSLDEEQLLQASN